MDAYGSFGDLQQAFIDFANKVPFYGAVVACADDAELCAVMPKFQRRVITYGIDEISRSQHPMVFGGEVRLAGYGARCVVERHERRGGGKPLKIFAEIADDQPPPYLPGLEEFREEYAIGEDADEKRNRERARRKAEKASASGARSGRTWMDGVTPASVPERCGFRPPAR